MTYSRNTGTRGALALLALLLVAAPAWSGTEAERIQELERKLEQSLQKIDALSTRLEQLESRYGANQSAPAANASAPAENEVAPAPNEPVTAATTAAPVPEEAPAIAASGGAGFSIGGVELHGFADVGFGVNDSDSPEGFAVGSLDFYLTPQLSDRIKTLIELIFEYDGSGDLAVDLERAQIGYVLSERMTGWLGRFHTPYGYWNTGFHHGQQIQTSISRPRFIDFEDAGGVLPAHTVGLWLTGKRPLGPGRLSYDLAIGNSPRIDFEDGTAGSGVLNMNNAGTGNQKFMFAGNLGYAWPVGLQLGAHVLSGKVKDDADNLTRANMLGGYAFYDDDVWEIFAEHYQFRNKDESGASGTHSSNASFVQLGRRIARWTPYARWERARYNQADNYFAQQASGRSYRRGALGIRFDLDPRAALKLELTKTKQTDAPEDDVNEARFQYSIRF